MPQKATDIGRDVSFAALCSSSSVNTLCFIVSTTMQIKINKLKALMCLVHVDYWGEERDRMKPQQLKTCTIL